MSRDISPEIMEILNPRQLKQRFLLAEVNPQKMFIERTEKK
jgi:hypothetical protein